MRKCNYLHVALNLLNEGKIDEEVYNAMVENSDSFCDEDERFPEGYSEIDYGDRDDPEAIDGMRFDDLNYLRCRER